MSPQKRSFRWPFALAAALVALNVGTARATDHDNLDAEHPLRVEDAESIAYGERNLEVGFRVSVPEGSPAGFRLGLEYLHGFAPNSHFGIEAEASAGGRAGSNDMDAEFESVGLSLFHNFNREYDNTPAFALRGDVTVPTGNKGGSPEYRLRGIMSRAAGQYGRIHLNLDAEYASDADDDEREFRPGVTLGYSRPLGYPTRFDRTGVAELSLRQSEKKGAGPVLSAGVGLRQQVSPSSVMDIGTQSDVAVWRNAPRDHLRFVVGYSRAF